MSACLRDGTHGHGVGDSEVVRSYLHLGELQRVVVAFPRDPDETFKVRSTGRMTVAAVQERLETAAKAKPPGTSVTLRTSPQTAVSVRRAEET